MDLIYLKSWENCCVTVAKNNIGQKIIIMNQNQKVKIRKKKSSGNPGM